MVEEYCDPKTVFARKRSGASPLFQLEQSINKIYSGMQELRKYGGSDEELEMVCSDS